MRVKIVAAILGTLVAAGVSAAVVEAALAPVAQHATAGPDMKFHN